MALEGDHFRSEKLDADELALLVDIENHLRLHLSAMVALFSFLPGKIQVGHPGKPLPIRDL
jgi:hypothetical protein